MKPLTLDKAMQLYDLIGEYIPNITSENEDSLHFIGTIINNIKDSGNHQAYIDAVSLMSNTSVEELLKTDYKNVLNLFMEGLVENQILSLQAFCRGIGY